MSEAGRDVDARHEAAMIEGVLSETGALPRGTTCEYGGSDRRTHVVDLVAIGPTLHRQQLRLAVQVDPGADETAVRHALRRPVATLSRRYDEVERLTGVRRGLAVDGIRTEVGHLLIERHSIDHLAAGHRSLSEGVGLRVSWLYAEPLRTSASNVSGLMSKSDNGDLVRAFGVKDTRVHWDHGPVAHRPAVIMRHDSITIYQRAPEAAVACMAGRRVREVVQGTPADDYVIRRATIHDDGELPDGAREFRLVLSLRPSTIRISDIGSN